MKRVLCLIFALVMLMSVFVLPVNAQDMTSAQYIYFQVPTESSVAWKNFSVVFCHIWKEGDEGGDFYPWQAKDERCTDLQNGYWAYDISSLNFEEDGTYAVIFSNENGMQTYNLTLTSECKGDIVVCEGDTCVNPVDSAKSCTVARWLENKDSVHPCAQVSSDGVIVDPDSVFNTDIDRTWGSSDGVSIEFPQVEYETQAPTEIESDTTTISATPASINITVYIIIGAVALVLVVLAVVFVIKRKRNG